VLQTEPVGWAAGQVHIQSGHRNLVNVVPVLVDGNKLVGQVAAAGRAGTIDGSARGKLGANGPLHRAQYVTGKLPEAEVEAGHGGVVQQGEGVADDVAVVDGPGIGGAVDRTIV